MHFHKKLVFGLVNIQYTRLWTSVITRSVYKTRHIPVKEQQYGQHGLVYVTVADALIEQEAGVPDHRIQGVLPHDVIDFVCIQVLVHELVAELAEVTDSGTGGAPWQCPRRT